MVYIRTSVFVRCVIRIGIRHPFLKHIQSKFYTQQFLHDGNPLDRENQVRNAAGILEKIGTGLLSFWIIMLDFQRDPNLIPEIISSK